MAKDSLTVLAVDDDPDVLKAVEICLRSTGWKVVTAPDGAEGVRLARVMCPDVILCDATMPKTSGSDVLLLLRSHPNTFAIPVVLMSGSPEADGLAEHFLPKPFGPAELRAAIEKAAVG